MDRPAVEYWFGAAGLEVLISVKGDKPELDDIVRQRIAETKILCLGQPADTANVAHLLHCTVPVGDEVIAMLPVFTRLGHVAAAVDMNPNWTNLQVLQMQGATVLSDLGPSEWLGINPWSGHEFKLPPASASA